MVFFIKLVEFRSEGKGILFSMATRDPALYSCSRFRISRSVMSLAPFNPPKSFRNDPSAIPARQERIRYMPYSFLRVFLLASPFTFRPSSS